jgi:hypothetical protein
LLGSALAFGLLARMIHLPFGRIHFIPFAGAPGQWKGSGPLGPHLLGVPIGWALLWVVLVAGARELVLWLRPRASHTIATLAGATLVTLTFLNLEPLASGRHWRWWFWYRGEFSTAAAPQWIALGAISAISSWLLRETLGRHIPHRSRKPALVFVIFNALLLATHLRWWLAPPEVVTVEWP